MKLTALLAAALTSIASAQSAPVSQTRTTRVFAVTHTAPDFSLFSDTNASGSPGSPTYQTAVQNSSMSASSIHVDVHFTWATTGPTVHNIDTSSRFSYTFEKPDDEKAGKPDKEDKGDKGGGKGKGGG